MKKRKVQPKVQPKVQLTPPQRPGSLVKIILAVLIIAALATAAYSRNSIYRNHVTLWRDVVKCSPDKRRSHENYGQALSTAGSEARDPEERMMLYKEALDQFKTVFALPDDGSVPLRDLYRETGVVYFRMALYDAAISTWETGLRYAPDDPSLLNNLSIALMQTGRIDEAAKAAQTALMGNPRMPQALNTMGQVCLLKKQYKKAANYFVMALEREPDVPSRYWNAALALQQAGKLDMAYKYANMYLSLEPNPALRKRVLPFIEMLKLRMKRS
jgi:tetratricopeptide (TPR) repeat protein